MRGIVIVAYQRIGYGYAAYNLLHSIKHFNKEIPIMLICDKFIFENVTGITDYEDIVLIDDSILKHNGKIDPAKVKFELYDLLPYEENLIFDADNICLKDITSLFNFLSEKKKDFMVQYVHGGGYNDAIDYSWAENVDIYSFFNLKKEVKINTLQSSVIYVKKSKTSKNIFDELKKYFYIGFPKEKVKRWGGTVADELYITGVLAKLNYDAEMGIKVDFLGHKYWDLTFEQIIEQNYLLSLYGNGNGNKLTKDIYIDWADRIMANVMKSKNQEHIYKMLYVMRDKHANFKQLI